MKQLWKHYLALWLNGCNRKVKWKSTSCWCLSWWWVTTVYRSRGWYPHDSLHSSAVNLQWLTSPGLCLDLQVVLVNPVSPRQPLRQSQQTCAGCAALWKCTPPACRDTCRHAGKDTRLSYSVQRQRNQLNVETSWVVKWIPECWLEVSVVVINVRDGFRRRKVFRWAEMLRWLCDCVFL